jgi:NAD(P)-dependent dehydrogenase (short-subunit alcohol dehydrogenase family)
MQPEYEGRIAVVTGGARGFGKAFAMALAERGAAALLVDIDAEAAELTAKELRASGLRAEAIGCDVADDSQVAAMVERVRAQHGGIDILINNAGLHSTEYNQSMGALGMQKLRRLFDVNVVALMSCSLAARALMAGRANACIVNISSSAAYGAVTAYGASKLAVLGLTMTLAREFAADGIRVNAIAPGMIGTETILAELKPEIVQRVLEGQILQRWGAEQDIVEAMLYLTSAKSSFVTGETLRVSGGFALQV